MSIAYPVTLDPSATYVYTLTTARAPAEDEAAAVISLRTGSELAPHDAQIREMLVLSPPAAPKRHLSAAESQMQFLAPGVLMSSAEIESRFGGVPLDDFRRRMSPEAFAAFVRFAGLVPGRDELNMVRISNLPEDPR
jgi:hypothetical protein